MFYFLHHLHSQNIMQLKLSPSWFMNDLMSWWYACTGRLTTVHNGYYVSACVEREEIVGFFCCKYVVVYSKQFVFENSEVRHFNLPLHPVVVRSLMNSCAWLKFIYMQWFVFKTTSNCIIKTCCQFHIL